jgi:F-type H+-transporting ATPase subunit b
VRPKPQEESNPVLIDWFTVGAQALNFLILVWLMKHFLYQPILNAINTREKKIAAELADAAAKKAEAAKDREDFHKKNEVFDQQRAALFAKATDEAKAERARLIDEARTEADAVSAKRRETLRNDAHNLNQAIARRTRQEVFSIARKALADLATASLEERIAAAFIRRLGEMDGATKEQLGSALKAATTEPAVVRSALELPAEERTKVQNAINEAFSVDAHLRFETSPDLISGIELTANGQKLAWSIGDYLKSLEKGVSELIKQQEPPPPKPEPKPDVKAEPNPAAESAPKPEAQSRTNEAAASKPDLEPQAKSKEETAPNTAPKPASETETTAKAKMEAPAPASVGS